MSIKLTNHIFVNGFKEALRVIDDTPDLPNQFAWDICQFVAEYDIKFEAFQTKRTQMLEKNCIKDGDGTPVLMPSVQIMSDGSKRAVKKYTYGDGKEARETQAVKDLEKCEIKFANFDKFKINLSDFKSMPKPKYLRALDGILDVRR